MTRDDRDLLLAQKLDELPVPELSASFYEELPSPRDESVSSAGESRVAPSIMPKRRRSWVVRNRTARIALVAGLMILALAGVGAVLTQVRGGESLEAIVSEKAYAAVTQPSGIVHEVVAFWDPSSHSYFFEEHWADSAKPEHRRIVQTVGGRLYGQILENEAGGTLVRYSPSGRPLAPPATGRGITRGGGPPDPSREAVDPLATYEKMLRSGTVESVDEIDARGRNAYRLVVRVSNTQTESKTATYIVDRTTYEPIQLTVRTVIDIGGAHDTLISRQNFLVFEVLAKTAETKALLEWDKSPSPFAHRGDLAPPTE